MHLETAAGLLAQVPPVTPMACSYEESGDGIVDA